MPNELKVWTFYWRVNDSRVPPGSAPRVMIAARSGAAAMRVLGVSRYQWRYLEDGKVSVEPDLSTARAHPETLLWWDESSQEWRPEDGARRES